MREQNNSQCTTHRQNGYNRCIVIGRSRSSPLRPKRRAARFSNQRCRSVSFDMLALTTTLTEDPAK